MTYRSSCITYSSICITLLPNMTGYGHTEFLKSLVTTYNPQEHAKTPILSYTPEYRILPKLNILLSCSHFYKNRFYTQFSAASGNLYGCHI